jgi:hypothetical protein
MYQRIVSAIDLLLAGVVQASVGVPNTSSDGIPPHLSKDLNEV